MTRVCVTWDREETARLIARCREALAGSDETAKAATPGPWVIAVELDGMRSGHDSVVKAHGKRVVTVGQTRVHHRNDAENIAHIAANDPSTRLALNETLRTVLDGIAATLGDGYQSRERDVEHALTSLAAITEALGVQEDGR